jgi:hypothetical protein
VRGKNVALRALFISRLVVAASANITAKFDKNKGRRGKRGSRGYGRSEVSARKDESCVTYGARLHLDPIITPGSGNAEGPHAREEDGATRARQTRATAGLFQKPTGQAFPGDVPTFLLIALASSSADRRRASIFNKESRYLVLSAMA